jgi:hypothetical protein
MAGTGLYQVPLSFATGFVAAGATIVSCAVLAGRDSARSAPMPSDAALTEEFVDRAVAAALLEDCRARQRNGEDFADIFDALLRSHDLVNGGVVVTAHGATTVRSIPLKGGWILLFDETARA